MAGQSAARLHDPIAHTNAHARFWAKFAGGLIGGIAVGFAAGVAAAAIVGTGGLAGPLVVGLVVVGARVAGGYVGAGLGEAVADALVPETLTVTGKITSGSSDVFINSKGTGAARASPDVPLDTVACSKDSPQVLLAEGAETVFINMGVASRKDDHTECGAKVSEGSPNVFIGGPTARVRDVADEVPLISKIVVIAINVVLIYKGLRCLPQLARQGKAALPCLIEGAIGVGMGIHGLASSFGNPVHAATGAKFLGGDTELDFTLPGPLPIVWQRFYNSQVVRGGGPLGQGWNLPYAMQLRLDRGVDGAPIAVLVDRQGRELELPDIEPGSRQYSLRDGLDLCRTDSGIYFVHVPGGLFFIFQAPEGLEVPGAGLPRRQTLELARVEDNNGNFIELRHDAAGRLSELTDSTGRLLALEHADDGRPQLRAVRLAVGAPGESPGLLVAYRHDAEGRLREVIDRNGVVARRFAYDRQGLMTLHADAAGLECSYEWTGTGTQARVSRHWTNDGERYDIGYRALQDGDGADPCIAVGETRVADQFDRVCIWRWNNEHQVVSYTNGEGRQWRVRYNALRQLVGVIEPGSGLHRCAYDAQGFMSSRTDPLGRTHSTGWTDTGLPWRETLPDGSAWTYAYSDEGNLVRETDPLGHVTEYSYDRRGLPILVTDARGGRSRLSWNECAQLVAHTDCSGKTTRYAYDGWGRTKTVTDAAGHETRLTHDAMGRLLSVSRPDGSHQVFQRDAAGRLVAATDALSRTTRLALGRRGEPLFRQDAEGRRLAWTYDAAGRLQSLVNENGQRYEFVRDEADRVIEERRVGGTRVQIDYDAGGRPVALTCHPGIGDEDLALDDAQAPHRVAQPLRTELVRDAVGRLVEKRTATHHYRYRYDLLDRLVDAVKLEVVNARAPVELRALHRTCFTYDKLGRLASETAIDEITGERHELRHDHDALGNRIRTVLPVIVGHADHAGPAGLHRALNYLHYGSGHLHQVNLSQQHGDAPPVHQLVSDIERDDLHREIARSQGALSTRFALDPVGRRTAAWCQPASLTTPFTTRDNAWRQAIESAGTAQAHLLDGLMKEYTHDPVGELRQSRHSLHGATRHRYDATGRIEETMHVPQPAGDGRGAANQERFAYDPAGNLLDAAASVGQGQPQRGYVRDNLVRVFEDKRYLYDGHGRLACKKSGRHTEQRFEWDAESRLVAVHTTRRPHTPEATTQVTRFDYDALGRRVAKHDAFGTTRFVWEGMRLIEERRGSHVATYVYEPGGYVPLARLEAALPRAGDDAAAATHGSGEVRALRAARTCYFHNDAAGRPEELSNAQGNLCWRASYRTWGSTVSEHWDVTALDGRPVNPGAQEGPPAIEQNLRLQGQYLDRDTGLHYNTLRFYDPDIGRFIGPDPIGLMGGNHLYQYAPNPIAWIDPLGLAYCNFGNATRTGRVRPGKDIPVDENGMVRSQAGELFPKGKSTTVDPQKSPMTGKYYEIPENTKMPEGIDIVRDGSDVIPGSPHGPGHATIFPTRDMPLTEFQGLIDSLPWTYAGSK